MTTGAKDILQSRLDFIGLTADARAALQGVQPQIQNHLETALDLFYAKISEVPDVRRFFDGKPQMTRAKSKQLGHWSAIATGEFDVNYMEASTRVGLRHAQIGLEPRWHIGGYGVIVETLVRGLVKDVMTEALTPVKGRFGRTKMRTPEAIMESSGHLAEALVSVVKAMLLDIDIGVSAYFDKLTAEAREADEQARTRIREAVSATGSVLMDVARGDLTNRVTAELDPEFDEIKDNTNSVVDRLAAIIGQLQETSRSLRTATSEILSGANDLSDRTTRQAAMIEQTAASVESLSGKVTENAQRASSARDSARDVARSATDGGAVMDEATLAMSAIESSSAKISNIIGMIDDIAFQTNLLALNASVEAARAGEAGKGFAVVAVEVRRLAQSAAGASADVKALVESSEKEVRNGAQLVGKAAEQLAEILAAAEESATQIDAIARANQEQSMALEEVTVAVRQMDEMTQHNAALVEETNAAIEQTESQVAELDQIVDVFRHGNSGSRPMPQAGVSADPVPLRAVGRGKPSGWH